MKKNDKTKKDKDPGHQYSRGLFFGNYDLYGPKDGSETSPGAGFYQHMHEYKSVGDFLNKARGRKKHAPASEKSDYNVMDQKVKKAVIRGRISYFLKLAGDVIDLSDRFEAKKDETDRKKSLQELSESLSPEREEAGNVVDLQKRKFLTEVEDTAGVWMHPFSKVHKDIDGFYILKSENTAGNRKSPGQLIADYAINMTPYWSITSISGPRINLAPTNANPFKSGVGAGGAKITEHDIGIFTGKYEQDRVARALAALNSGNADIDDVKYILLGTCPVRMGPNGGEGGWYNPADTYSSRGGMLNMTTKEIIKEDAKKLHGWGFDVPKSALEGTISEYAWKSWIEGNPESERENFHEYEYEKYELKNVNDLKNQLFNKDRRVIRIAFKKLYKLIEDGEIQDDVLKDVINFGGSPDYMTNERIIYHFANKKDADMLKLCINKLSDYENKDLAYMKLAEIDPESTEELLKTENTIEGLYRGFSELKSIHRKEKGGFTRDKDQWAIDFIKNNSLIQKAEDFSNRKLSYSQKDKLQNLLGSMASSFCGTTGGYYINLETFNSLKDYSQEEKNMYAEIITLLKKVQDIKTSSRINILKKIARSVL